MIGAKAYIDDTDDGPAYIGERLGDRQPEEYRYTEKVLLMYHGQACFARSAARSLLRGMFNNEECCKKSTCRAQSWQHCDKSGPVGCIRAETG